MKRSRLGLMASLFVGLLAGRAVPQASAATPVSRLVPGSGASVFNADHDGHHDHDGDQHEGHHPGDGHDHSDDDDDDDDRGCLLIVICP